MKTIILNWYGPYSDENINDEKEFGSGIYIITGKQKYEREAVIQYCGITERTFKQRLSEHHKKESILKDRKYWLAEIIYPKKTNRSLLELAEKIIIYFWQPALNEKKIISQPDPTTIINQWFNLSDEARVNQLKIYKDLSDVISWDGEYWRTGNLKVWQE